MSTRFTTTSALRMPRLPAACYGVGIVLGAVAGVRWAGVLDGLALPTAMQLAATAVTFYLAGILAETVLAAVGLTGGSTGEPTARRTTGAPRTVVQPPTARPAGPVIRPAPRPAAISSTTDAITPFAAPLDVTVPPAAPATARPAAPVRSAPATAEAEVEPVRRRGPLALIKPLEAEAEAVVAPAPVIVSMPAPAPEPIAPMVPPVVAPHPTSVPVAPTVFRFGDLQTLNDILKSAVMAQVDRLPALDAAEITTGPTPADRYYRRADGPRYDVRLLVATA